MHVGITALRNGMGTQREGHATISTRRGYHRKVQTILDFFYHVGHCFFNDRCAAWDTAAWGTTFIITTIILSSARSEK